MNISKPDTNRGDLAAVSLEASRRPLSSDISIGRVRCRQGRFPGVRVSENAVIKSRKNEENLYLDENASNPGYRGCVLCAPTLWSPGFCSVISNCQYFDSFSGFPGFLVFGNS